MAAFRIWASRQAGASLAVRAKKTGMAPSGLTTENKALKVAIKSPITATKVPFFNRALTSSGKNCPAIPTKTQHFLSKISQNPYFRGYHKPIDLPVTAPTLNSSLFTNYRRQLHQKPELSGKEAQTASQLKTWLAPFAPSALLEGVGGAGFCAIFDSQVAGPTILIRAELDALPISESTEIPHASKQAGISHKCGHDGHMAILIGLASRLHASPPDRGKVILLFQPAEETGAGAALVLADPRFVALKPDVVYALHNLPGHPLGEVIWRDGAFAAASAGLVIALDGHTSHASEPELGQNPAPAFATLLAELPALAKAFAPTFGLITVVGCELGGQNFGISAGSGRLACTLRAFTQTHFEELKKAALALIEKTAKQHQLKWSHSWHETFEAVENLPECNQRVVAAAQKLQMPSRRAEAPFRWSEDFGRFTQQYAGCLFGLGAGVDCPPLHHPDYDFPDELIETGSKLFYEIIREELK